jgi:hypothetical protein
VASGEVSVHRVSPRFSIGYQHGRAVRGRQLASIIGVLVSPRCRARSWSRPDAPRSLGEPGQRVTVQLDSQARGGRDGDLTGLHARLDGEKLTAQR